MGPRITDRLHFSYFLLTVRILYGNPKKELLWSLWVYCEFQEQKGSSLQINSAAGERKF